MYDFRFSLPYGGNVNGIFSDNMEMTLYCTGTASLLADQETTCSSVLDGVIRLGQYVQVVIIYLMMIASPVRTT